MGESDMGQESIDKLLDRDDIYNSTGEVFGLYLKEYFINDPNLWQDLLSSWATDTNLWIYDGDLRDLDKIVNESGGRFSAPEVALELGNLYIRKAPLIKWLKEKQDSAITITTQQSENKINHEQLTPLHQKVVTQNNPIALVSKLSPTEQKKTSKDQFVIPDGIEWGDIRMHFETIEKVLITIGKTRAIERTWSSFHCFNYEKSGKWKKGWEHLFIMAIHKSKPPKDVEITTKQVSDLQKNLKHLFPGVYGNPFARYSKEHGWTSNIILSVSNSIYQQHQ